MHDRWPPLPLAAWKDTYATLHRWTQIPGKIQLLRTPLVNHFWNVALAVTPEGLATAPIPDAGGAFSMTFDFCRHVFVIARSEGQRREIALAPKSVADFYGEVMDALEELQIAVRIWTTPVEIPEDAIPFERDRRHASYDRDAVARLHRILLSTSQVLGRFRGEFTGKSSPVHFFWGSFDLCVTRFSGRRAPERPDADAITREAYSHENASVGFWPGGGAVSEPAFYAYAAPEPDGFRDADVRPAAARYRPDLKEFVLPYEAVRASAFPEEDLLSFAQSTYNAAADCGGWDRATLERTGAPAPIR
jgi:hypothetical protein